MYIDNAHVRLRGFIASRKIPLWLKLLYTFFAAILVSAYWRSTPLALLWFCNMAVLITLAGLWLESSLLLSTQILAVFWPHLFWQIDYGIQITTGLKVFHFCGLTPTDYMFDPKFPPLNRILSMQHAWLLYLLLWTIWRLGYDRRALLVQIMYAWLLLLISYALTKDLHGPAGNVNNILGMSDSAPQTWMAPWLWLAFLMLFLPMFHYAPLHFVLRKFFHPPNMEWPTT